MTLIDVNSFVAGRWTGPGPFAREIRDAVTDDVIARAGNEGIDPGAVLDHGRKIGGPVLRKMTFHDRARMLKALALHLDRHKQPLYDLSFSTGATRKDAWIDIDGGIGTLFVYASKGRREMPDSRVYLDGGVEQLSRSGTFKGLHVATPVHGVAVHINAFNFPVWGMLEKLAPTILAGVPAIVKPATSSCYVTEAAARVILDSGILPDGVLQLVTGGLGDMLDMLTSQDVVSFTGSAGTARLLRSRPNIINSSIRFVSEQDSLNASILGPDAVAGTPEFDIFIEEARREITTKAGQKCTAIRRILAPEACVGAVTEALKSRLERTRIGDPRSDDTEMGALISRNQKFDVLEKASVIAGEAERVSGDPEHFRVTGADRDRGAFLPPMLFVCSDPDGAGRIHETEAFGPVSTIMGYRDPGHAIELANRGGGSLVASIMTHDPDFAREVVLGSGAFHGRLYFNDRQSAKEATGHGSPLPHMVHGGPGRAGGSEELGGMRGVMHYMQRTAVQGSPDLLTAVGDQWVPGAGESSGQAHPFTRTFHQLEIGETIHTAARRVTLEDIEHFAGFTGDTFYAHMDDAAARRNPFFPGRVAHGYLLLSFAAGLFVEPSEGPVLANTGLTDLKFMKPVEPGDSIRVRLTVKRKTPRNEEYGEVRWHVTLINQDEDHVAEYELRTMNAYAA